MDYRTKILVLRMIPGPLRRSIVAKRYRHEIESTGEAELPELRKLVKRGDLALDVGSNLGVYAYELGRLTGRVIAFEPNPTLAAFVSSVAMAGVEVRQMALSCEDGTAELSIPLDAERGHGWASVVPGFVDGPVEKVSVPMRRLDSLQIGSVAFVKVDAEGAEQQVLEGARETIARDHPILLIEIGAADLQAIVDRLSPEGYQGAFFRKGVWHPLNEFEAGTLQNMDKWRSDMVHSPSRRDLDFVNNFLFLPPGRQLAELN